MIPFHRDLLVEEGECGEDFHGCFAAQPFSSAVVCPGSPLVLLPSREHMTIRRPSPVFSKCLQNFQKIC